MYCNLISSLDMMSHKVILDINLLGLIDTYDPLYIYIYISITITEGAQATHLAWSKGPCKLFSYFS